MSVSNEVPLMFQAQVPGRGQIQYVGKPTQAERWVDEWVEGASVEVPQFRFNVKTQKYKITWRFVSNSGQDEDVIRPVIAAKGFPFYPGASMKGAFLRACTPQQAIRYCGGKLLTNDTQPGILRFHGGYPQDANWAEEPLVDVVHPQENWQVKNHGSHSAFIQISLYQPTLVFGISSTVKLDESEWDTIWNIWDRAIERGIGSRVSAGYGQPIKHPETKLIRVTLSGQGLASQLFDRTGEFRPNMFKAALRGHTMRLFSGVTDENTAEALTRELWGGFSGRNNPVVGVLGIAFNTIDLEMDEYRYNNVAMPIYKLNPGTLSILCMGQVSEEYKKQLKTLVTSILRFAMLLGGFGKSWRRIDHSIFFPDYLNNHKPMIGCHWTFTDKSTKYYFPVKNLNHITIILNNIITDVNNWLTFKGKQPNTTVSAWREAWNPQKVQVWGRAAKDEKDSAAVKWFHGDYQENQSIKGSSLTGKMSQIGRIWHRMYPHYIKTPDGETKRYKKQYIELLTIFPEASDKTTQQFLEFLNTSKIFTKLWGE
jgi:CRISPR-associated protein Cmr6